MITESFSVEPLVKKVYPLLPRGIYQCELVDVEYRDSKFNEGQKEVNFTFRVIEEGENYGRIQWVSASVPTELKKQSPKLFEVLSSLTDKSYGEKDYLTFNEWFNPDFLNALVGVQRILSVSQRAKKTTGELKNVVDSILPIKENLPAFDQAKVTLTK